MYYVMLCEIVSYDEDVIRHGRDVTAAPSHHTCTQVFPKTSFDRQLSSAKLVISDSLVRVAVSTGRICQAWARQEDAHLTQVQSFIWC